MLIRKVKTLPRSSTFKGLSSALLGLGGGDVGTCKVTQKLQEGGGMEGFKGRGGIKYRAVR